jgi:hypothetical protein
MTKKVLLVILMLALGLAVLRVMQRADRVKPTAPEAANPAAESGLRSDASHEHAPAPARVPAYQSASEGSTLAPTLAPTQFVGKARQAYKVAKEIPGTLAQLPCYCECDKGLGHKSLHTCFVDDHASHCAVCVDEALLAYMLEKQQKFSPEQVREQIIEKYSAVNRRDQ